MTNNSSNVEFGNENVDSGDSVSTPNQSDPDEFFTHNAFRVIYQTSNFLLPQIRDLISSRQTINLRPEYQRRLRWTNIQKSKLIESLLLNIPIPPIFLYENDAARYEVMDGQQRLNAVEEFFTGGFELRGLTVLEPLNKLRYKNCPPRIKRALDRSNLSAIILLLESGVETPSKAKIGLNDMRRFVFDRLNTGGRRLNAQEIRNALNPGALNDALIAMTRLDIFTDVFGIPPYKETDPNDYYEHPERQKNSLYSSMRDCELALRFVALRDPKNISGSMKAMLDRAMKTELTKKQANNLVSDFEKRMVFLHGLFGGKPFRLPTGRVSAAMYDAGMVAMDRCWKRRNGIQNRQALVKKSLNKALSDSQELEIMTGRGNTAAAVRERIELFRRILLTKEK